MLKLMIGAIALAVAVPALAEQPPATDEHAEHGKARHDCKECCEKMKQQDGKMDCMEKEGDAKPAGSAADHQGHDGHAD
jgi:hypothetical protein